MRPTVPAAELPRPPAKAAQRERLWLYDTTLRDGQQSQGVDFSVEDKAAVASALDGLGIDYVEGGWPGANPTDSAFFEAAPRLRRARLAAFGMTKRSGRSAANDEVLAGGGQRRDAGGLPGRQGARVPCADRARGVARGEPREHRGVGGACRRARARGDPRRRAFLRRLEGEPRLCARLPAGGARRRGALGGALRHQRRHAAGRGRGDHRGGGGGGRAGREARDPRARRHRQRGGEHARGGRRRGAAGAGDAERARRALRQRQPREPDSDAGAEGALCVAASRPGSRRGRCRR